jgi:hypothetical protein
MKPVEKTVVHNVELVSNLDYLQPLDRSEEVVAITSCLNYLEPENPPVESGVFREAGSTVFQKIGEPKDHVGAVLSDDKPLMQ